MSLLRSTYSLTDLPKFCPKPISLQPEDCVRRVTIKQLLTADEDLNGKFCISQKPLGKLTLVANVYKNHFIESKSKIFYGFDDGSGRIRGFKADTGFTHQTFAPFAYATIVGQLQKDSDGSATVKVLYMLPLNDPHEIYFHILHVIFDDLRYQRGNPGRKHFASHPLDHQIQDLVSELDNVDFSNSPLSELEQDIIVCIENMKEHLKALDSIDSGIQISRLVSEVSPRHQGKIDMDFLDAIERLLRMGFLRTTIDEHHLDTTD